MSTHDLIAAAQRLHAVLGDVVVGMVVEPQRAQAMLRRLNIVVETTTDTLNAASDELVTIAELAAARAEIELLTSELTAQRKRIQALESAMTVEKSMP